ncbi:MAG: hypothetical protein ACK52V_06470 [Betaproteobacteria bacterium]
MKRHNVRVAERVAKLSAEIPEDDYCEGVMPLAIGHFMLDRMRSHGRAKERNAPVRQIRGGRR